jgi:scytalone dehydratase
MPAEEYLAMASNPEVLGDPLLMTQHFIGGSRWEKVSEDEVIGYHQLRVPHQRWTDATRTAVAIKGHAHSANTHWYKKINGVWKFAGLNPEIRWGEYDFDQVFAGGRGKYEEAEAVEAAVANGIPAKLEEPAVAPVEAKLPTVDAMEVQPTLAAPIAA